MFVDVFIIPISATGVQSFSAFLLLFCPKICQTAACMVQYIQNHLTEALMLLSAEHLSMDFGDRKLLEDVNFY